MAANIYVFVPAYQQQILASTVLATHALSQACMKKGIGFGISSMSLPDIADVRDMALSVWYDHLKDYSHILFVDADMAFQPELIFDMLLFDQPVVGTLYPKKTFPLQFTGYPPPPDKQEARAGHMRVSGMGFGITLIRRDAVTTMLEKMPELVETDFIDGLKAAMAPLPVERVIRAFQKCRRPGSGVMSEDYSFCWRWEQCGGEVWANVQHDIQHVGYWPFTANYTQFSLEEQAKQKAAPVAAASPWRVKDTRYGKMKYNINDTFIGRSLDAYGEWCQFEMDLLSQIVRPGDWVMDVGANIGTHALAFSKMVGKDGGVWAFEAQPRLLAVLDENRRLNEVGNVLTFCNVVADVAYDEVALRDLPADETVANFGALPPLGSGKERVRAVTIDGMQGPNPIDWRLIKIDVEGMESDVIYGALQTIARCKPFLYVENNGDDSAKIWEALEEIGYEALWSIGPYFNPNNFLGNKVNIWPPHTLVANLICAPKGSGLAASLPMLAPLLGPDDNWRLALKRMTGNPQSQAAE